MSLEFFRDTTKPRGASQNDPHPLHWKMFVFCQPKSNTKKPRVFCADPMCQKKPSIELWLLENMLQVSIGNYIFAYGNLAKKMKLPKLGTIPWIPSFNLNQNLPFHRVKVCGCHGFFPNRSRLISPTYINGSSKEFSPNKNSVWAFFRGFSGRQT